MIYHYCRWLTAQEGMGEGDQCYGPPEMQARLGTRVYPDALQRRGYRLPTEAEWEFACRAGTTSYRFWGDDHGPLLDRYVVPERLDANRSFPGGRRKGNDLGLFDPLGNVWEWCHDPFGPVRHGPGVNPDWGGPLRRTHNAMFIRGCAFTKTPTEIRSARRRKLDDFPPSYGDMGFRLARTLRPPPPHEWAVRLHLFEKDEYPADEAVWARVTGGTPARMARLPELAFEFAPGGADENFVLVAEKTFGGPAGEYRVDARADDFVRVFVDGVNVSGRWVPEGSWAVTLRPGSKLRVEFIQFVVAAGLRVTVTPRP